MCPGMLPPSRARGTSASGRYYTHNRPALTARRGAKIERFLRSQYLYLIQLTTIMASRRDTSAAAALFRFRRGYSQRRLRRHYTVGERARQDRDNNGADWCLPR